MKANLKQLRAREKYINEQEHPSLDLIIWNYNQVCQFSKAWDKYTMMCRGLITDTKGNIVARPFSKFFNWGQDTTLTIPTDMPIISDKLDGSMGILYFDGDQPKIATRGSFSSEQAIWATNWMARKGFARKSFIPGKTYLFEILYPENRIVVDYGNAEELVLLAVIDTETGDEMPHAVENESSRLGITCAPKYKARNISEVFDKVKTLSGNEEGYVFHWPQHKNLRLKIKGTEYLRLHRLLTEFSTISIWELLKEKKELNELLERVPDEFYQFVEKTQNELLKQYEEIFNRAKRAWLDIEKLPDRKSQALKIQNKYPKDASLIFAMISGKDPSPMIWKQIRPEFQKPFSKDIDV